MNKPLARLCVLTVLVVVALPVAADWQAGEAAFQRGDFAAAAREFAKYVENRPQDPRYAVAYYMLGSCYLELDRADLAEPNLRAAVDLDPVKADYRLALGQYLVKAGEYEQADAVFDELDAASVAPAQQSTVALLRAKAALEVGDATKAVAVLEAGLASNERSVALHRALGLALERAGATENAYAELARTFELDPADASSGRRAVDLALDLAADAADEDQRQLWNERALEAAEHLVAADASPRHQALVGEAAFAAGRFEIAANALGVALEGQPDDTRLAYLLGRSLAEMGDDEKALAVLTEAVSHRPDAELAGRIHRQVGKIQARGLELEAAVQSFTLAGDEETAHMIQEIGAGFGEALEARRELVGKIAQLRAMELELESLNDAEGVTAMRQRTAAFEQELDALEDNLEQVRQALRDL